MFYVLIDIAHLKQIHSVNYELIEQLYQNIEQTLIIHQVKVVEKQESIMILMLEDIQSVFKLLYCIEQYIKECIEYLFEYSIIIERIFNELLVHNIMYGLLFNPLTATSGIYVGYNAQRVLPFDIKGLFDTADTSIMRIEVEQQFAQTFFESIYVFMRKYAFYNELELQIYRLLQEQKRHILLIQDTMHGVTFYNIYEILGKYYKINCIDLQKHTNFFLFSGSFERINTIAPFLFMFNYDEDIENFIPSQSVELWTKYNYLLQYVMSLLHYKKDAIAIQIENFIVDLYKVLLVYMHAKINKAAQMNEQLIFVCEHVELFNADNQEFFQSLLTVCADYANVNIIIINQNSTIDISALYEKHIYEVYTISALSQNIVIDIYTKECKTEHIDMLVIRKLYKQSKGYLFLLYYIFMQHKKLHLVLPLGLSHHDAIVFHILVTLSHIQSVVFFVLCIINGQLSTALVLDFLQQYYVKNMQITYIIETLRQLGLLYSEERLIVRVYCDNVHNLMHVILGEAETNTVLQLLTNFIAKNIKNKHIVFSGYFLSYFIQYDKIKDFEKEIYEYFLYLLYSNQEALFIQYSALLHNISFMFGLQFRLHIRQGSIAPLQKEIVLLQNKKLANETMLHYSMYHIAINSNKTHCLNLLKQAVFRYQDNNDTINVGLCYTYIGILYLRENMPERAHEFFSIGYNFLYQNNSSFDIMRILVLLAVTLFLMKDYAQLLQFIENKLVLFVSYKKYQIKMWHMFMYFLQIRTYFMLGQYQVAKDICQKTIQYLQNYYCNEQAIMLFSVWLARCEIYCGNTTQAYSLLQEYSTHSIEAYMFLLELFFIKKEYDQVCAIWNKHYHKFEQLLSRQYLGENLGEILSFTSGFLFIDTWNDTHSKVIKHYFYSLYVWALYKTDKTQSTMLIQNFLSNDERDSNEPIYFFIHSQLLSELTNEYDDKWVGVYMRSVYLLKKHMKQMNTAYTQRLFMNDNYWNNLIVSYGKSVNLW